MSSGNFSHKYFSQKRAKCGGRSSFFSFTLDRLVKPDIWLLLKGKVVHKDNQNEFFEIHYTEIIGMFLTHELQPQRFPIQKSEKKFQHD